MSESVSVVDVAARAGVSLGTVSNVLNRPTGSRRRPATRCMQAIDELGFVRNEAARQLRAGRSRTIGLVVLDVGNPFFTDLAAGVEASAGRAGLSVVLCNSNEDADRERHYLPAPGAARVRHPDHPGRRARHRRSTRPANRARRSCWSTAARTDGECSVSVDDVSAASSPSAT